ncbi:MAG: VWA domain-containing protein [Planctomycetes bacterium]|nr:VWA domain-containing protein [Planctomycetota bacterium]
MGFLHPEFLLLALPAAWLAWKLRTRSVGVTVVRALVLALLVLALASPYLRRTDVGRDLVVVVDRSQSMPAESERTATELLTLIEDARESGDRVGIVAFGRGAAIERLPSGSASFSGFTKSQDGDGSNLARAIDAALELIPKDRPGSLALLSDGEETDGDALAAARRAFARGVRVDVRPLARSSGLDVAVEALDLPDEVALGEPFQFSGWLWASAATTVEYELLRDGTPLSNGKRELGSGANRLLFRDRAPRAGVATYTLRVRAEGDQTGENDVGLGALRVVGAKPVLVVNHDGLQDALVAALAKSGVPLEVRTPEAARLSRVGLAAYRAVVLENVAASRVGLDGMKALDDFVRERGGGLLVTGGKASFGLGGYYKSTLDELLPVSLEMRQEKRKQGVAQVIVMDRSGSMAVEVQPGVQKMDLANRGAAASIELLTPVDSIGVIVVDSSDHVIQPLSLVDDPAPIVQNVLRVQSSGGGIYCYTGLRAAARMLDEAPQANRHVVLFADAADSEEQEGCMELVGELVRRNTTLSVIALGTETDSDAQFLKDLAAKGEGAVYFTMAPDDLPRLFAQDTLTFARSTFVDEPTAAETTSELFALGDPSSTLERAGFPTLGGYNLTYLRPDASVGVLTADEHRAPVFAFAQRGLGRSAAFTGEVGGTYGAQVIAWPGFADFFVTATRWLAGLEEPTEVFTSVRREGRQAVIAVEVDPAAPRAPDASELAARVTDPGGAARELELVRVGDARYEARFELERAGVSLGTLQVGAPGARKGVALPPIVLSYSPEFAPRRDRDAGARLLARIAQESGGENVATATDFWRGSRDSNAWRSIARELVLAAILLWLVEIATRRLELFAFLKWPKRLRLPSARRASASSPTDEPRASDATAAALAKAAARSHSAPARAESPGAASSDSPTAREAPGGRTDAPKPRAPDAGSAAEAMARARAELERRRKPR